MSSYSESEGEIVEVAPQKATTALPSANDSNVDRQARARLSVSQSPAPRSEAESSSLSRSPRGEKRRYEDDDDPSDRERSDPRRSKVHYEERSAHSDNRRDHHSPKGSGRGGGVNAWLRDDEEYNDRDDRARYASKRFKARSRSPYRAFGKRDYGGKADRRGRGKPDFTRDVPRHDRRGQGGVDKHLKEVLVSDRARSREAPPTKRTSKREAEIRNVDSQKLTPSDNVRRHAAKYAPSDTPAMTATSSSLDSVVAGADKLENGTHEISAAEPAPPVAVDEASLIEERRKRREAIKAKYKSQATPLLAQALQLGNDSDSRTSMGEKSGERSERSVSPTDEAPQTPQHDSGQASPTAFTITNDEDLANNNVPEAKSDADEPSAADYDPTMDMREDQQRNDQRHNAGDLPSAAYDETQLDQQKVLLPERAVTDLRDLAIKPKRDDVDMFADEDDDDMFAPGPVATRPRATEEQPGVAVTVPKALDMNLLDNWDDTEGYYRVILGELFDGRYRVQANLGKGMFSGVVRALDSTTQKVVAIKIIRNNETMRKAGMKEIEILQKLNAADADDRKHIIRLERSFEHKGHLCMVFENLSINLREVLKKFGRDVGINLKAVRSYAQQMFLGLSLLRKCNILHADVKPDNVLVNETRNVLKICDLGSAADALDNEITPYLVSRFYRAPEIMLGMPYDFAIDTWSIGCTLFELYTGKILFTGRTNNQMLRSMMECRGKFSIKMLKKAAYAAVHFDDSLNFKSVETDKVTGRDITRLIAYSGKPTRDLKSRIVGNSKGLSDVEVKDLSLFVDLLDRCLNLNPERRCTPTEALKHPFIARGKV